jgi:protocatechuate 3,4-dioxygenase beta subunit
MTNDDAQIGRLLSRREVLALLGASGAVWLPGCRPGNRAALHAASDTAAVPACVVRPEQTEGPYFVDERLNRSDIRSEPATSAVKAGTPLALTFSVMRVGAARCAPIAGAQVDVWQCDADGVYSDARDPSFDTRGQKFLRGYQVTDARGEARFQTIYPGWYNGRTVHIHFKIRTEPAAARGYDFTSQVYFDDALSDRVLAAAPYNTRGERTRRNEQDGIFRRGGDQLMLSPVPAGEGYAATFAIGLEIP